MRESGFHLDFKDFDMKFNKYCIAAPDYAQDGLREAAQQLKLDADNIPPKTPVKEGHLKGSGKVENPKGLGKQISIEVGYDTPYAARLHEAEKKGKWTEPDSGPKYLEAKMVRYAKKYMAIVAKVIKSKAG